MTFLTLISRLVGIAEQLNNLDPLQTSIVLLSITIGDIISSLSGGFLLDRYPTHKVLLPFQVSSSLVLIALGFIISTGSYWPTVIGCFALGLSLGAFNVGMNIAAVTIEQYEKRTLLPRFHAFFSMGAALATIISTLIYELDIPLPIQFCIVGGLCLIGGIYTNHHILDKPMDAGVTEHDFMSQSVKMKIKRLDLSILLLTAIIVCSNLAEGAGENWLPLGTTRFFDVPESVGTTILGIDLLFATVFRFFGSHIIDRLGKQVTMRFCLSSALLGLILCCLQPWLPLVYLGAMFWGIGVSLGYPIGVSEAAAHPEDSAFRTSLIATIGSVLGIAAPPLFGLMGNVFGVRYSLLVIIPFLVLGLFATKILPTLKPAQARIIIGSNKLSPTIQNSEYHAQGSDVLKAKASLDYNSDSNASALSNTFENNVIDDISLKNHQNPDSQTPIAQSENLPTPASTRDLDAARLMLFEHKDLTLVLVHDDEFVTYKNRGIRPLMQAIDSEVNYTNWSAADKLVGKASALLLVALGVKNVYTPTISRKAVQIFDRFNVYYLYDKIIERVLNQDKTDACPMEKLLDEVDEPEFAYRKIKEQLNAKT
jgi:MFS family permease